MMNENVKKAYVKMVAIQNYLRHSDGLGNVPIGECMDRLSACVTPLLEEEDYAFYAKSLQQYVEAYHDKRVEKEFIIEYTSKLTELIDLKSTPTPAEEARMMREEAKAVCEDVASAVQLGFQATKERIKSEGPRYAAGAVSNLRKIGDNFQKWLNDVDGDETGEQDEN